MKKLPSIVFVSRKFPPSVGGMENFARDLYDALDKNLETHLIKWGGSNKLLPFVIPYLSIRSLLTVVVKKPEIIHIQDGLLSPLGYVLSKVTRRPYTVVIHGLDITFDNYIYQKIIPRFVSSADKVFCISNAAAEQAVQRGVPSEKVLVIPLGASAVDTLKTEESEKILHDYSSNLKDKKILLTVGRLVRRKGVAWFVKNALPEIVKENPDTIYLIVGTGEEYDHIKSTIKKANMENYTLMLGRVSDTLLEAAYKNANVFVMPNIPVKNDMEGFGIVLVEAAMYSLPIVATGIEGILDATTDKKSAFHVKPMDATTFIRHVNHLLANDKDAKKFGIRARKYTEKEYSWNAISQRYINSYLEVI